MNKNENDCPRCALGDGSARIEMAEHCLAEIRALLPRQWEGMEIVWCVMQLAKDAERLDWVPVAERLPKAGRRVLVTALNGIHVWRTVGEYWPAGTMDASNWDDPPEDWWDEDGDKCTNPEPGWYEAQIETETNYQLTGVSHWMILPALPLPNGASEPRAPDSASKGDSARVGL